MGQIGTYPTYQSIFTPDKILVEPGDSITWDMMDIIAQFSQRLLRCISTTITLGNNATCIFYYGSLSCDNHPPYLKSYFMKLVNEGDPSAGSFSCTWNEWRAGQPKVNSNARGSYCEFREIGLGSAVFYNKTGTSRYWELIAFL